MRLLCTSSFRRDGTFRPTLLNQLVWWGSNVTSSLIGIDSPSFDQIKNFVRERRTLHSEPDPIKLTTLCAILGSIMVALSRVTSPDEGRLKSHPKGLFGMFPELRAFLLRLYSDDELHAQEESRFRCGIDEIDILQTLYDKDKHFWSENDRTRFKWVMKYLELAYEGAFRGSELLFSSAKCDKRSNIADWRKTHTPAILADCHIKGSNIVVGFRQMKNQRTYTKNYVTLSSPKIIRRILRRAKCRTLSEFNVLCRSQNPEDPHPLLPHPKFPTTFVSMDIARRWLQDFLKRVMHPNSRLQRINLHSPRAGFATNMARMGVPLRTIMHHGRWTTGL